MATINVITTDAITNINVLLHGVTTDGANVTNAIQSVVDT